MIKGEYSSIYNMRPDELYGMGKESLTVRGTYKNLEEFMYYLVKNSQIKHENCLEWILSTDEFLEREDWKPYIGQPMFYIVDISYEEIDDDKLVGRPGTDAQEVRLPREDRPADPGGDAGPVGVPQVDDARGAD